MDQDQEAPVSADDLFASTDPELAGCAGCCAGRGAACTGRADDVAVSQVLVKFERTRRAAWYVHGQLDVAPGDRVVVETDRGTGIARVLTWPRRSLANRKNLRRILKVVTDTEPRDARADLKAREREAQAFDLCWERIEARRLPMRLVTVEFPAGDAKAVFYFAAEARIDFRDLVRDLSRDLRCRVEMRQIGVRDQAKMTGGLGICGIELCCSSWLRDFTPVTIKMAKVQGLVLNPQKVSGQCGRLLCCLSYEHDQYKEARKGLPKPGAHVQTPAGEGRVRELDIMRRRVQVSFEGKPPATFEVEQLAPPGAALPPAALAPPARADDEDGLEHDDFVVDEAGAATDRLAEGAEPGEGEAAGEGARGRRRRRGGRGRRREGGPDGAEAAAAPEAHAPPDRTADTRGPAAPRDGREPGRPPEPRRPGEPRRTPEARRPPEPAERRPPAERRDPAPAAGEARRGSEGPAPAEGPEADRQRSRRRRRGRGRGRHGEGGGPEGGESSGEHDGGEQN
jgi:cell fate regulator YaaT (PSP1 superfamily)